MVKITNVEIVLALCCWCGDAHSRPNVLLAKANWRRGDTRIDPFCSNACDNANYRNLCACEGDKDAVMAEEINEAFLKADLHHTFRTCGMDERGNVVGPRIDVPLELMEELCNREE